jgi:hypothetical protein
LRIARLVSQSLLRLAFLREKVKLWVGGPKKGRAEILNRSIVAFTIQTGFSGGTMSNRSEFWQRPVNDRIGLELIPGEMPRLLINQEDRNIVILEFSEAQKLIEVLTTAVGELLILKKDPAALATTQILLAEDVTLRSEKGDRPGLVHGRDKRTQVKEQELIRQYRAGRRKFTGADLSGADLQAVDLRGIDLEGADLTGANLGRANLFYASLKGSDLRQANLEEAGLFQANLQEADLTRANLHRAYLLKANLLFANVSCEQLAAVQLLSGAVLPDGTLFT